MSTELASSKRIQTGLSFSLEREIPIVIAILFHRHHKKKEKEGGCLGAVVYAAFFFVVVDPFALAYGTQAFSNRDFRFMLGVVNL